LEGASDAPFFVSLGFKITTHKRAESIKKASAKTQFKHNKQMTTDKVKDFWRDFIKAWEHLDDIGITEVVAWGMLPTKDFETGQFVTLQTVFSKHAVDSEAIRYLGEFRQTFAQRLTVTPYDELQAYQREYNAYNSDFVETRKTNMSITLLIDNELLPNSETKIKCIIRNSEIKYIDFSVNDQYSKNRIDRLMFPLNKLDVIDASNGFPQIGYAQLSDTKKGKHVNKIYFAIGAYPLLPYVIGKAYYCSYLFNEIEQIEREEIQGKKINSDKFDSIAKTDLNNESNLDNESKEHILIGEVTKIVAKAGHIFRPTPNSDWGIDGEIEFKNKKSGATGKRVYVQLKSGKSYLKTRKKDGKEIFRIKNERHITYWQNQHYPVMLVIRIGDVIKWMNITEYLKNQATKTKSIVFDGEVFSVSSIDKLKSKLYPRI